jgi:Fic family protein
MVNDNLQNQKILELQKKYLTLGQGKENLLQIISESEIAEQVYNSNAIENSTLTLEETDRILLEIDLDRFVNQREMFEAKNLARVVNYIDTKSKNQELTIEMIEQLHKMLLANIDDQIAGKIRTNQWVRIGSFIATDPVLVNEKLSKTLLEYTLSGDSIVQKISKFHLLFESIHPFVDGNGRIGRILNNYLLIRANHVPIIIDFASRQEYYQAFKEFQQNGSCQIMNKLVTKALINSYNKRIAFLQSQSIITLQEYAKTSPHSLSNLINKANRATIPAFRQNGRWVIGI